MTRYQYTSIISLIWLVLANQSQNSFNKWSAVALSVFFALEAIWLLWKHRNEKEKLWP